jgi:hypothetical protein
MLSGVGHRPYSREALAGSDRNVELVLAEVRPCVNRGLSRETVIAVPDEGV